MLAWLGFSVLATLLLFLGSSRELNVAGHDAVLEPDLSGQIVVDTGPVLPDLRMASDSWIGVDLRLGKTDVSDPDELLERYGLIASAPEGTVAKVRAVVQDLALDSLRMGLILGLIPVLGWALIGSTRRRELSRSAFSRNGLLAAGLVLLMVGGLLGPWWDEAEESVSADREWIDLATFLGPGIPLPSELAGVEVRGDATTIQTRRLVESAIDTYDKSKEFYAVAAESAGELTEELRQPEDEETVVTFVSDRHDNIGMDPVARAVGDAGGATAVFNGGDDTSTGKPWEAFSLDSVSAAFEDQPRWGVAGNHDHGTFVPDYLRDRGWAMLDGEIVEGPGESTLLGVNDPRSSGLGSWRDETGLSFGEVGTRLADQACEAAESEDRVATLLVHDAKLGAEALRRGCVDLVLGGHLHTQVGPDPITGENGRVGYSFTTGTTGGAAYAIALGSKIRRAAQITLITYREGRPVGLQPVMLNTNGVFDVREYVELDYTVEAPDELPEPPPPPAIDGVEAEASGP